MSPPVPRDPGAEEPLSAESERLGSREEYYLVTASKGRADSCFSLRSLSEHLTIHNWN